MPVTRTELLAALKDASITSWLRSFVLQQASSMSIGRFPGTGSAQNDNYVYPDAADATFPYNFDYEIPNNFQRIISAKLSFKIRPYRTYSSLTLSSTGNASGDHTHTGGTTGTESANHAHTIPMGSIVGTATVIWGGPGTGFFDNTASAGNSSPINNENATHNHSGGTTSGQSSTHTHTVSGSTVLGIAEDVAPVNPGITVAVDGTDVTAKLGGPFNADMVEVDVSQVLKTTPKVWHVMSLQPNQRVRITGILRISYLVDSRLAQ